MSRTNLVVQLHINVLKFEIKQNFNMNNIHYYNIE